MIFRAVQILDFWNQDTQLVKVMQMIQNSEITLKSETLLVPSTSKKEYTAWSTTSLGSEDLPRISASTSPPASQALPPVNPLYF